MVLVVGVTYSKAQHCDKQRRTLVPVQHTSWFHVVPTLSLSLSLLLHFYRKRVPEVAKERMVGLAQQQSPQHLRLRPQFMSQWSPISSSTGYILDATVIIMTYIARDIPCAPRRPVRYVHAPTTYRGQGRVCYIEPTRCRAGPDCEI